MSFNELIDFFGKIDRLYLYIVGFLVALIVFYVAYHSNVENFDNVDACIALTKTRNIVVEELKNLEENDEDDDRERINKGINYRDMQTRDIVLGDDNESWCSRLNDEEMSRVKAAIEDKVNTEVNLMSSGEELDVGIMRSGIPMIQENKDDIDGYDGQNEYDEVNYE